MNATPYIPRVQIIFLNCHLSSNFCIMWFTQVNDSECSLMELAPVAGHTVKGYAVFDGPTLTGRVTFVSVCKVHLT